MEPLAFKQRPDSALPVRFFALGLLGFLLLNAGIALAPHAIRYPLGPNGILLLHLTILGWITPVMMGADYQLIPVVLHRPIPRQRLADVVLWLYAAGAFVFLTGWGFRLASWIAAGGTAAGCALVLFCAHAGSSLLGRDRGGPTAVGLGAGMVFLALTAVLGPWMALSIGAAVPAPSLGILRALHAVAGLGGWLLLTIMGATYQLVPFFAATEPTVHARFGTVAVLCTGGGTVLLLVSGLVPALPAGVGLAAMGIGLALWMYDLGRLARHGRQARREPVVTYSLAAAAVITLGAVVAAPAWGAHSLRLALAGSLLGLLVGPSLLILGQLQKILPFIAALDAALAAKRRRRAPKTEVLFPRQRAFAVLWVLTPGFGAEVAGVAVAMPPLIRAGAVLVLLGGLAYAVQQERSFAAWAKARSEAR